MTTEHSDPRRDRAALMVSALVLIGLVLRLRQFIFCRSLWLDEAMLAVSIAARSPAELLQPLEYNQNAPILFLWLSKLCTWVMGVNEQALRALPQIAGGLVLVALPLAARRAFGAAAAIVCAALAALSPALIRYANEAKPYGVDAFVTAALLLAFVSGHRVFAPRSAALLAAIASLGVLLSNPAVFTATAIWAALGWAHRGDRGALKRVALSGLSWILTFAVSYAVVVRPAAGNELVRAGYSTAFLPPSGESAERLPLMISGTFFPAFGGDGTGMPNVTPRAAGLITVAFFAGLAFLAWHGHSALAVALGGPVVLAFSAAALGLYPVGVPRLMVFQFPCVLLTVAGVIGCLWPRAATPRLNRLGLILFLLILWPSWLLAWGNFKTPFEGDNFRDAYNEYASLQLDEPVYVGAKAQPAWLFYSTNWTANTRRQRTLFADRLRFYFAAGGQGPSFENRAPRRGPIPAEEGRDLVFDFRGRKEVLGIATGRQWKWGGYVGPVDADWALHESTRLRNASIATQRPCEWIVLERMSELAYRPLRDSLRFEHNGRRERQLSYPGVTIGQICHSWKDMGLKSPGDAAAASRLGGATRR
jgi:hypothetical protein